MNLSNELNGTTKVYRNTLTYVYVKESSIRYFPINILIFIRFQI